MTEQMELAEQAALADCYDIEEAGDDIPMCPFVLKESAGHLAPRTPHAERNRLGVIGNLLHEGDFDEAERMWDISSSLRDGDFDKAERLHNPEDPLCLACPLNNIQFHANEATRMKEVVCYLLRCVITSRDNYHATMFKPDVTDASRERMKAQLQLLKQNCVSAIRLMLAHTFELDWHHSMSNPQRPFEIEAYLFPGTLRDLEEVAGRLLPAPKENREYFIPSSELLDRVED